MRHRILAGALAGGLGICATVALAEADTKTIRLNDFDITLHLHDFLTKDDLATLRVVTRNKDALALFVPDGAGFAALAVSPDEGFTKDNLPVASASALSGLVDAESARAESIKACQAAAKTATACVVILEIAPAK